MVSTNSSPPIAMPVQVPPGHVVQQIVDESGTLRHVILSPQHPAGLVPLPSHTPQHYVSKTTHDDDEVLKERDSIALYKTTYNNVLNYLFYIVNRI